MKDAVDERLWSWDMLWFGGMYWIGFEWVHRDRILVFVEEADEAFGTVSTGDGWN